MGKRRHPRRRWESAEAGRRGEEVVMAVLSADEKAIIPQILFIAKENR
jgi:hypothetical protein